MKAYGDIESVNLSTGERFQRVSGDGESRLVRVGCAKELARCDREIARIYQEAYAGNPDVDGILLGLHYWRTEKKLILDSLNSASMQGFRGVVRSCKSESGL